MNDNYFYNQGIDLRHRDHHRSISIPSPVLIYQQSSSIIASLMSFAEKSTTKGSKIKHPATMVLNNPCNRSNFGDIMAFSFDFPKLYAHFMDNNICNDNHGIRENLVGRVEPLFIKKNSRIRPPPDNYICRLCNIGGHWIEQCVKFKSKNDFRVIMDEVCAFCHDSEHKTLSCTRFVPINNYDLSRTRNPESRRFTTGIAYNKDHPINVSLLGFIKSS